MTLLHRANRTMALMLLLAVTILSAVPQQTFAEQGEILEGTEFYVGIPYYERVPGEQAFGDKFIQLWIASKTDANVKIEVPNKGNTHFTNVVANTVKKYAVEGAEGLVHTDSEVKGGFGIVVTSDQPISVTLFTAYTGAGESVQAIPYEFLGTEYYTMNLYQDIIGSEGFDYPGEFLVIATEDQTAVQYTPTAETEKGAKPGQTRDVILNRGETFLVKAKIKENFQFDWSTDLTGTHIRASKPIAVITGHSNGAYTESNTSDGHGKVAALMRNMLVEQVLPIEYYGTDYVLVPFIWNERRVPPPNIPYLPGDLVRFVATKNGTVISRNDGENGLQPITSPMMQGEVLNLPTFEVPTHFVSNHPVLVAQYGKAYDQGSNWIYGAGMLVSSTPLQNWGSDAAFYALDGVANFVYITFLAEDEVNITFDGRPLSITFGPSKPVEGSPYKYVIKDISAGDHFIEATDGAKFAAYSYGHLDGAKSLPALSYGHPIGINYALPQDPDEYSMNIEPDCGNMTVHGTIRAHGAGGLDAAGFHSIVLVEDESNNYDFNASYSPGETQAEFTLEVQDPREDARGVIRIMDRTGNVTLLEYDYIAEKIIATPTPVIFDDMVVGEKRSAVLSLENPTNGEVKINRLWLEIGHVEFSWDEPDFPMTFAPGEVKELTVYGEAFEEIERIDKIFAELSCYDQELAELRIEAGEPILWVGDATFDPTFINKQSLAKTVKIENRSLTARLEVYGVGPFANPSDQIWFDAVGLEKDVFPIIIEPGDDPYEFQVFYTPNEIDVQHEWTVQFESNATQIKDFSVWSGTGIDAGPIVKGWDFDKRRVLRTHNDGDVVEAGITVESNTPMFAAEITLVDGPDSQYFTLGDLPKPNFGIGDEPVFINTTFTPDAERTYSATIKMTGRVDGEVKEVFATLIGEGIAPQPQGFDHDFDSHPVNTTTDVAWVPIQNVGQHTMYIWDVRVAGDDASNFVIDEGQFDVRANAGGDPENRGYEVLVGREILVPIQFTPDAERSFTAVLEYSTVITTNDGFHPDSYGVLTGAGFSVGTVDVITHDEDFGDPFIHKSTTDNDEVGIENVGSIDGRIVTWSVQGADAQYFDVLSPIGMPQGSAFDLPQGRREAMIVTFNPEVAREHEATIIYEVEFTNGETRQVFSTITGRARELFSVVSIPRGYTIHPGSIVRVEYRLDNDNLNGGNLTEFTMLVRYDKRLLQADPTTVVLEGPIADWEFLADPFVKTDDDDPNIEILYVEVYSDPETGEAPLDGSGTMFTFAVDGMLDQIRESNIVPVFAFDKTVKYPYITVDEVPGDIQSGGFCAVNMRPITVPVDPTARFGVTTVAPNPAVNNATLEFGVGFDVPVRIALYNSVGEEITVLVDGPQKAGRYELTVDISQLPSGTYLYRMEAGPFSDTKTLNIAK